ncbi:cytochrome c, partial [Candidatus Marinimicrobia bacterium]|nr:cytochrome c [Candidatus Neomarinimicrobiota bacterium]
PNMDNQQKYRSLEESYFFEDGSTMRTPIEGTIARGQYDENASRLTGKNEDGSYIASNPVALSAEVLDRGEERFNIYCIVCHSQVGNGKGIITQYDYPVIPANLHDERIRLQPDGEMYNTIRYGLRSMPAYGYQIESDDVWSIVHYVRALQRSQNATFEDLPKEEQEKMAKES